MKLNVRREEFRIGPAPFDPKIAHAFGQFDESLGAGQPARRRQPRGLGFDAAPQFADFQDVVAALVGVVHPPGDDVRIEKLPASARFNGHSHATAGRDHSQAFEDLDDVADQRARNSELGFEIGERHDGSSRPAPGRDLPAELAEQSLVIGRPLRSGLRSGARGTRRSGARGTLKRASLGSAGSRTLDVGFAHGRERPRLSPRVRRVEAPLGHGLPSTGRACALRACAVVVRGHGHLARSRGLAGTNGGLAGTSTDEPTRIGVKPKVSMLD